MSHKPQRTSIWSISEGWLTAYFLLFTVQFVAGVSFVIWYETIAVTHDSTIETLMNVLGRSGTIPILSASTSYIFAEGGRLTMVISNWVEKKLEERRLKRLAMIREQGRKEGFEQGRAYERERIKAETNGQASDDPHRENGR